MKMLVGLTEYGAARRVPGSKAILYIAGERGRYERHLFDCGVDYAEDDKAATKATFPFSAKSIDSFVNTHGHTDHMGKLLELYLAGFRGPIHATATTIAILKGQLKQQVQGEYWDTKEYNAAIKGKRGRDGKFLPFRKPRFKTEQVKELLSLVEGSDGPDELGHDYGKQVRVSDHLTITFYEAGHIPGSSQILCDIVDAQGRPTRMLTCFDLGRTDYRISGHPIFDTPLVRFPHTDFPDPDTIDTIVVESTYGAKEHEPLEDAIETLVDCFHRAHQQKGKLIIPAFSIMRTQMLLTIIYRLKNEGRLPEMPIYFSSPSGEEINKVILRHLVDCDETAKAEFKDPNNNPFKFPGLTYVRKSDADKALYEENGPFALIGSSGMGNMGRIVAHLKHAAPGKRHVVMYAGFQALGTPGYQMLNHEPRIRFPDGDVVELKAYVAKMGGLSGHADGPENVAHVTHIRPPGPNSFKRILIKHGESASCDALRDLIIKTGYEPSTVIVMEKRQEYSLP